VPPVSPDMSYATKVVAATVGIAAVAAIALLVAFLS
jgi:hypothetical protein